MRGAWLALGFGAFVFLGSLGDRSAPGEVRARGMLVGAVFLVLGFLMLVD